MRVTELDSRTVFVVHGRNRQLAESVCSFLRAIDLRPLLFSDGVVATGKAAPYVGEVLDALFSQAQAVVVLFTPDDEARLRPDLVSPTDPAHEKDLTYQARPNVIFEAGMALARDAQRTVLVEIGTLRPFSDIGGRHVVRLANDSVSRHEFARRLGVAGCPINLTHIGWHTAGNFDVTTHGGVTRAGLNAKVDTAGPHLFVGYEHLRRDLDPVAQHESRAPFFLKNDGSETALNIQVARSRIDTRVITLSTMSKQLGAGESTTLTMYSQDRIDTHLDYEVAQILHARIEAGNTTDLIVTIPIDLEFMNREGTRFETGFAVIAGAFARGDGTFQMEPFRVEVRRPRAPKAG